MIVVWLAYVNVLYGQQSCPLRTSCLACLRQCPIWSAELPLTDILFGLKSASSRYPHFRRAKPALRGILLF